MVVRAADISKQYLKYTGYYCILKFCRDIILVECGLLALNRWTERENCCTMVELYSIDRSSNGENSRSIRGYLSLRTVHYFHWILEKRNLGVICGHCCSVGWHNTNLSQNMKIHTSPKSFNAVESMEDENKSFRADCLKIDAFKDRL
jgi:hypothetical protein